MESLRLEGSSSSDSSDSSESVLSSMQQKGRKTKYSLGKNSNPQFQTPEDDEHSISISSNPDLDSFSNASSHSYESHDGVSLDSSESYELHDPTTNLPRNKTSQSKKTRKQKRYKHSSVSSSFSSAAEEASSSSSISSFHSSLSSDSISSFSSESTDNSILNVQTTNENSYQELFPFYHYSQEQTNHNSSVTNNIAAESNSIGLPINPVAIKHIIHSAETLSQKVAKRFHATLEQDGDFDESRRILVRSNKHIQSILDQFRKVVPRLRIPCQKKRTKFQYYTSTKHFQLNEKSMLQLNDLSHKHTLLWNQKTQSINELKRQIRIQKDRRELIMAKKRRLEKNIYNGIRRHDAALEAEKVQSICQWRYQQDENENGSYKMLDGTGIKKEKKQSKGTKKENDNMIVGMIEIRQPQEKIEIKNDSSSKKESVLKEFLSQLSSPYDNR